MTILQSLLPLDGSVWLPVAATEMLPAPPASETSRQPDNDTSAMQPDSEYARAHAVGTHFCNDWEFLQRMFR